MLLLQTRDNVTAPELATRLEVSVRTIRRDVDALSAAGVPVWMERGRNGGIRLLPNYHTDVTGLTVDEARALFVQTTKGVHRELGLGDALGPALLKVMGGLPETMRPDAERIGERILIDPARWMGAELGRHHSDLFAQLQQAVLTDRRVLIDYRRGGATEPSRYTVDPYGLVSKAGVWYLVADRDGEPRLYRVDRVQEAQVSPEPVRRRRGCRLIDVWDVLRDRVEQRGEQVAVDCLVRDESLDMVLRLQASNIVRVGPPTEPETLPAERTDPIPEGWTMVRFAFPAIRAVRMLLCFADDVEVVAPAEARAELSAAAASILGVYSGDFSTAPNPPFDAAMPG